MLLGTMLHLRLPLRGQRHCISRFLPYLGAATSVGKNNRVSTIGSMLTPLWRAILHGARHSTFVGNLQVSAIESTVKLGGSLQRVSKAQCRFQYHDV